MFDALFSKGKDLLLRMFDIRVGEFRRVWLMQLNVFLLIQCLWIIKPIVNAQFLSRVGIDKLPLVFLLVAISALAVSTSYSRLQNRVPLGTIMIRTYLISIIGLLLFALLLHFDQFQDWMSYFVYIGIALFGLVTTSQFWLLGNLVFTSLEAKRLFGFIGAGAIAGGISGGYVTSILAPVMDSKNLLFFAAALLLISMIINYRIWTTYVPAINRTIHFKKSAPLHEYPFRLIRNSKHLTYLALIMGISVVVAKLVEFQFSAIASSRIQDPDQLSAFFGFWFSTSNVVSLGIQLLVTQRLLGFLGVGKSLFILPGALFASAAVVLYTPVLWAGTTLKLFDISLKQSINKAATELLIVPVPLAIKSQAKTFIDIFVDTTATGIGGIMLIFLINGFNLSVRAVCIMILLLICVWVYFVVRVRREYVLAFEEKLGIHRQVPTKKESRPSRTSIIGGIRRTLKTGNTKQILYLLDRIEESKDQRLMADTIPLLKHESPKVRQAALRCLYYTQDHTIKKYIEPLLKDPEDEVRSRAFSALLAQTRYDRVQFINSYLVYEDPAIRGAALVGLATEARDNLEMQKLFNLEQRLRERIEQVNITHDPEDENASKVMIARTIGYGKLSAFYPQLSNYMSDKNHEVARQAILSAGRSQDKNFIRPLLNFLPNKTTRTTTQKALARYEPSDLLMVLSEVSNDKNLAPEVLIHLPELVERMDTQHAVDYLLGLVQHHDPVVKLEALEALHKIRAKFPKRTISSKRVIPILQEEVDLYRNAVDLTYVTQNLWKKFTGDPKINDAKQELNELLERRKAHILERIFWVLGLTYPPSIILPLLKEIRHNDPGVHMNAIELLDNILEPGIKKIVMPILEIATVNIISLEILERLELQEPNALSSFKLLLEGDDDLLKLASLRMLDTMDHSDFSTLLHLALKDDHPRVKALAEKLLAKHKA